LARRRPGPAPATGSGDRARLRRPASGCRSPAPGRSTAACAPHVAGQAIKAAESICLNVAEAHPATGADRARRFRIAADEASESGAALDLLEIRGALDGARCRDLRKLLDRERAMLWRL